MEIYFKPHSSRVHEQCFFRFILDSLNEPKHIQEDFVLPYCFSKCPLNRDEIIDAFESDVLLSLQRKKVCISALKKLPNEIRISKNIGRISIDYAIKKSDRIFYIEFHELQHRKLHDDRLMPIYSKNLEEFRVPRCLQRILRDIWRWKYLDNIQVFWSDWFEVNQKTKIDFASLGKNEYSLPGKFSFKNFVK